MSHPAKTAPDLYEEDYVAWIERQAAHLRAGRLDRLDLPNLAEELEDMSRRERRELWSRLRTLLAHLLKRDHQPQKRTRSWDATIVEQRSELNRLLRDSPSLHREVEDVARDAYGAAVRQAVAETGLRRGAFPATLPYGIDVVLGEDEGEEV